MLRSVFLGMCNLENKDSILKNVHVYNKDVKECLKYGAIGFLGFGAYHLGTRVINRGINSSVEFKDRVDCIHLDPIIRDAFINLQEYRELNTWMFRSALQNCDKLLFLERALLQEDICPVRNDKIMAFTFFKMAVARLNMLQTLVKQKLGAEHAMVVNMYVLKVYEQLQRHFLNVLHKCSEFKPDNLIRRADAEIKALREEKN